MSEVLRSPWILQSVLDDLSNDVSAQSGLNHLHRTPKLVQIIQFVRSGSDSTHMLGHLSDKFHYILSFFSDQSLGRFSSRHPNWSVGEIQGAIIRLMEYKFVKVPCTNGNSNDSIILVVEDFEHVGSDGSPAFGDPRYVACNPGVVTALQRPAPPSPSRSGKAAVYDYSFTQSLDPSDLLFLETTCTQTLQKQSVSFPQVVRDADWRIPAEQEAILGGVELLRVAEYEYSDVELSEGENEGEDVRESKKVREEERGGVRVVFPLTQSSAETGVTEVAEGSYTQAPMPMTQAPMPMTQAPLTQAPLTQAPLTQAPMTQAPLTQPTQPTQSSQPSQPSHVSNPSLLFELLSLGRSPQKSFHKSPQKSPKRSQPLSEPLFQQSSDLRSPKRSNVVFPETQVSGSGSSVRIVETAESPLLKTVNVMTSTPVKSEARRRMVVDGERERASSPINSPVKAPMPAQAKTQESQPTASHSVLEFPDYSSW